MLLTIGGEKTIENPTPSELRWATESLDATQDESFLILEQPNGDFLQISGDVRTGFSLEYLEIGEHYVSAVETVALQGAVAVCEGYAALKPDWRAHVDWQHLAEDADYANAEEWECFGQNPPRDAHRILGKLQEAAIPFEVEFEGDPQRGSLSVFVRRKHFPDVRAIVADFVKDA